MAGTSITLKVTPQELKNQAKTVTSYIDKIQKDFDAIRKIVNQSDYWRGSASETHRKMWEENEDALKTLLSRLREHPIDLEKMAGVYSAVEEESAKLASELPDNVIS